MNTYKYYQQTRPSSLINITNHLALSLSQLNITRIISKCHKKHQTHLAYSQQLLSSILFICVHGMPPLKGQYDFINLSSYFNNFIHFYPAAYSPYITQQDQLLKEFNQSSFKDQADNLYQKINQVLKPKSKIIILFHSFGTFITHSMFYLYPQITKRIIGIIDLGGAPIRFQPQLFNQIIEAKKKYKNKQELLKNANQIYQRKNKELLQQRQEQLKIKDPKKRKSVFLPDKNKYQTISSLNMMISPQFEVMFKVIRQTKFRDGQNILRLIIYGDIDTIWGPQYLHQKSIYFSFSQNKNLSQKMNKFYIQYLNKKHENSKLKDSDRIQSKFIFALKDGKHSIHFQKSLQQKIRIIIEEYLDMILRYEQYYQKIQKINGYM